MNTHNAKIDQAHDTLPPTRRSPVWKNDDMLGDEALTDQVNSLLGVAVRAIADEVRGRGQHRGMSVLLPGEFSYQRVLFEDEKDADQSKGPVVVRAKPELDSSRLARLACDAYRSLQMRLEAACAPEPEPMLMRSCEELTEQLQLASMLGVQFGSLPSIWLRALEGAARRFTSEADRKREPQSGVRCTVRVSVSCDAIGSRNLIEGPMLDRVANLDDGW